MSQRRNGRHGGSNRKRPNRYNPNAPDWKAIHASWARAGAVLALPVELVAAMLAARQRA